MLVEESQEIDYDEDIIEYEDIDPEYDEDGNLISHKPKKTKKNRPSITASLTTAAKLYRNEANEPEPVAPGTLVRHSEHGLGTVKDFWGQGDKRRILVEFFTAVGWMELPYPCDDLVVLPGKKW